MPDQSLPKEETGKSRFSAGLDRWFSLGLFFLAASILGFYLTVTYRFLFHSDSAMKLLLAEQMAKNFTLFPRDWNYVNDIWLVFPSLVAAPLSLFFAPSLALHTFVDVVVAGLVLYAAYVAARAVGIEGPLRWFVPTLLASGFSTHYAENVFGQSAYSATLFTLLLLSGWGARYLANSSIEGRASRRHGDLFGIAVLLVTCVAEGPRGLASYAAPLLFAIVGVYVSGGADRKGLRHGAKRLGFSAAVATVAGGLLFLVLIRFVRYGEGAVAQHFSNPSQIANHLRLLVSNWLELFDALPPADMQFSAIWAAVFAARLGMALLTFFLPLFLLPGLRSRNSPALSFLVLLHAGVLITTSYLFIFTGVVVDEVHGRPRYLIPLVPTAVLVMALWLQLKCREWGINAVRVSWILAIAILDLAPIQMALPAFQQWPVLTRGLRPNPHASLVAALRNADLHRGFAGYWNAGAISVLSGGDVRAAPVDMRDGTLPAAYHHLTSDQWYASAWANGPTFLALDHDDQRQINRPALDAILGTPTSILHVDNFEILVYPFNISDRLGLSAQPFVRLPKMTPTTCAAENVLITQNIELSAHAFGALRVHATNRSNIVWSQTSIPHFNPGLRIIDAAGKTVSEYRGLLPHGVKPGEDVEISVPFRAPDAGHYSLNFSFIAEGDSWCGNAAANWAKGSLTVNP